MRKSPLWIGMVIVGTIGITGCSVPINKPIVVYERNAIAIPKIEAVKTKGLYVLFPGNGTTPLEAVYLYPGDRYGFQSHEGRVSGIYIHGGKSVFVPLDGVLTSDYVWKFEGEKQP